MPGARAVVAGRLCGTSPAEAGGRGLLPARGPGYRRAAVGWLAQPVERFVYTEDVGGSNPSPPTNYSGSTPIQLGFKGFFELPLP